MSTQARVHREHILNSHEEITMLGLCLLYVGAVLFLNGLWLLGRIGDREIWVINVFAGGVTLLASLKLAAPHTPTIPNPRKMDDKPLFLCQVDANYPSTETGTRFARGFELA